MSLVTLRIGKRQESALEINIWDVAHNEERQSWWPRKGAVGTMVYDEEHAEKVARLLTDCANSEDFQASYGMGDAESRRQAREACASLTALVGRVRRCPSQLPRQAQQRRPCRWPQLLCNRR